MSVPHFLADDRTGFSLRFSTDRGRLVLFGELDHCSAPLVAELAPRLPVQGLEVDLAGLTFLSSAGLDVLVELFDAQRAAGQQMTVVGVSPRLARIFGLGNCSWLLGPARPSSEPAAAPARRSRYGRCLSRSDRRSIDDALRDLDLAMRRLARQATPPPDRAS